MVRRYAKKAVNTLFREAQAMSFTGIFSEFSASYGQLPKRVHIIDAFAAFQLTTAVVQVGRIAPHTSP